MSKPSEITPPKIIKLQAITEDKYQFNHETDNVDKYLRRKITGSSAIYKASLDILLCHFADFHKMTLEILCRKHELDFEEVLKELQEDKDYKEMMTHPLLNTFMYMSEDDVEAEEAPKAAEATPKPETKPKKSKVKIIQEKNNTIETTFKNIAIKTEKEDVKKKTGVLVKKV
jgi:hypothetical protein